MNFFKLHRKAILLLVLSAFLASFLAYFVGGLAGLQTGALVGAIIIGAGGIAVQNIVIKTLRNSK